MSIFISWILSILGIVIIGTLLDILLSEKKIGKQIRSVLASLVVLIIISPLPILINGLRSCEFDFGVIELDEGFIEYANSRKVASLERGLERALANEGFENVKAEIVAQIDVNVRISFVTLDLTEMVLSSGVLNINRIERVRNLAAELLFIDRGQILIIY